MKRKFLAIMVTLVMVIGLIPATAFAAATSLSGAVTANGTTYNDGITLSGDTTMTIIGTVTVNNGIDCKDFTLTIEGSGTLKVTGSTGTGGQKGGNGVTGNIVVNCGTVNITGGTGVGDKEGGVGVQGNIVVKSGTVNITGGTSGDTHESTQPSGGTGVKGKIDIYGGDVTITGGAFGKGSSGGTASNGFSQGSINIYGGKVTINGGGGSGPSDGGYGVHLGSITLTGGEATLIGGNALNSPGKKGFAFYGVDSNLSAEKVEKSDDGSNYTEITSGFAGPCYLKLTGKPAEPEKPAAAKMIEQPDHAWNGQGTLKFRADIEFEWFTKDVDGDGKADGFVTDDGVKVDPSNYTAYKGSTCVELKPEYLATLSAGEHILAIHANDGTRDVVSTGTFVIGNNPPTGITGDSGMMSVMLACLSLAIAFAGIGFVRKFDR